MTQSWSFEETWVLPDTGRMLCTRYQRLGKILKLYTERDEDYIPVLCPNGFLSSNLASRFIDTFNKTVITNVSAFVFRRARGVYSRLRGAPVIE